MPAEGRWRRAAAVVVAGVAILTASVLLRPGPQEPGRLVGETPADGARLPQAPANVELTFSGTVDPAEVHLAVQNAAGRSSPESPDVDGPLVRVPVRSSGDGTYRLTYHVGLRDGQEVSGTTAFTVGTGAAPAAGGPPVDAGSHEHLGSGPVTVVVLTLGGLLTLAVLPLVFRRRVR